MKKAGKSPFFLGLDRASGRILAALLILLIVGLGCSAGAETETFTITKAKELLKHSKTKMSATLLLDNDIELNDPDQTFFITYAKEMVIDGQGHALKGWDTSISNAPLQVFTNGLLRFQNISVLAGSIFCNGKKQSRIELENVMLRGEWFTFRSLPNVSGEVFLSNVRTEAGNPSQKYSINFEVRENSKLILDQSCRLGKDCRLIVNIGGKAEVNCDYYDAELTSWTKEPVSFAGEGKCLGTFKISMLEDGNKATADINTEELLIEMYYPDVKKKQTVEAGGTARVVRVRSYGSKIWNNKLLKLNLTGVEQLRFELQYRQDENPPKDSEEFRNQVRKSLSHISLKKVTDAGGNPIRSVEYLVYSYDENGQPVRINWTDPVN